MSVVMPLLCKQKLAILLYSSPVKLYIKNSHEFLIYGKTQKSLRVYGRYIAETEKNRTLMASMRGSETKEQILEWLEQNMTHMASMTASETAHEKLH